VVTGDAALTRLYAGMVPAGLVLACGIFGNMPDAAVERTTGYRTRLCASGGTVIWTRERGFEREWLSGPEHHQCCGAHRFTGPPGPARAGRGRVPLPRPRRAARPAPDW
jgi:hypothetical protein